MFQELLILLSEKLIQFLNAISRTAVLNHNILCLILCHILPLFYKCIPKCIPNLYSLSWTSIFILIPTLMIMLHMWHMNHSLMLEFLPDPLSGQSHTNIDTNSFIWKYLTEYHFLRSTIKLGRLTCSLYCHRVYHHNTSLFCIEFCPNSA